MKQKKGRNGFLRQKQYMIAGTLVILAAIGTTMIYSHNQEEERARMEAELTQEMNELASNETVQESAEQEETREVPSAQASAIVPPETVEQDKQTAIAEETETTETAELAEETDSEKQAQETATSDVKTLHFNAENGILWPAEGNVILNYSMDSTVYFATLDQYKYNPAVIIAGEVNSKVYSVAPGQIVSIENDEETGCTVTVDLGDGYQAVYGQLKELNFSTGDYVEAGHVLGYISEPTKYYSVEGSNLYFQLKKDGSPIDPVEFFQ